MNNVEKVKPNGIFTNYIFKSIPLAFDESMSYYECLCGLLDYLKNTVIPTINNNADAIIEVQNLFTQLQNYVDNYFTNLDVQEEINNKLDEMVEDGTMDALINTNLTGSLSDLETTDKSNLVSAINEVNDKVEEIEIKVVTGTITQNANENYATGYISLPNGFTKDDCAVVFKNYMLQSGASKTDSNTLNVSLTYDNTHGNSLFVVLENLNTEIAPWTYTVNVGLVKVNYPS